MANVGMQGETVSWLNGQIVELDKWRADMAGNRSDGAGHFIDRLDAHRAWLADAIADLTQISQGAN
ncbi:MAG: hypothetical protein AAF292_16775 [Pseudomonadota bacterium]